MDAPLLSLRDALGLGTVLVTIVAMWMRMEVSTKWVRDWCRDHREDDQANFARLEQRIDLQVSELNRRIDAARGMTEG